MYESLFETLSEGALSFIDVTVVKVSGIVADTILTLGTLYVIWFGYQLITGKIKEPAEQGLLRILKFVVLLGVLMTTELYLDVIVDAVWRSPDFIANLVTSKGDTTTEAVDNAKFLDTLLDDVLVLSQKLSDTGGFRNPKPVFTALLMEAVIIISTAYAFFLFALSKIMIAVLLGVGAFFIVLYLFESTQKFFESWFNQIMNYLVLYLLVSAVLSLLSLVIEVSLEGALASDSISLKAILQPVVFIIVTWIIMLQLTSISSSLGGGVALSTMGAGAMAMNMFNKMRKPFTNVGKQGAKQVGKQTGKYAGKGAEALGSKAMNKWRNMRRNRASKA